MRLIKQKGKVQHDYLFMFDEYVKGWEQFVGVNLRNGIPIISEIKWREKFSDEESPKRPLLNATTYRDFPIGNVSERINAYIEIEKFDDNKFANDVMKQLDYFKILELVQRYTAVYPQLQTKWKDERNVLLYISYYLLFLNNVEGYNSSGDLHKDLSEQLGISKSNSIQILNRLKNNGYLESTNTTNSLIPSVKTVKILIDNWGETLGAYLDAFRDELIALFFETADEYYFNIFEHQYWDEHHHEKWVAKTTTAKQDEIALNAFWEHMENIDEAMSDYSLPDICYMTPIEKFNKYVLEVDDIGFVTFKIDSETLTQIRRSSRYENDHILLLSEHIIDEILEEIGKENYLENKELVDRWAKEANTHQEKLKMKALILEDEAPF